MSNNSRGKKTTATPTVMESDANVSILEITDSPPHATKQTEPKLENTTPTICEIHKLLIDLSNDLKIVKSDVSELKQSHSTLIASIEYCSGKIDDFEVRMTEFDAKVQEIDRLEASVNDLKNSLSYSSKKILELEQYSRQSSIEIQGIPEREGENLLTILSTLGNAIRCPINTASVYSCHRVRRFNTQSKEPKNVVVKFTTKLLRDDVLTSSRILAKSSGALTTMHVGIQGSSPIFVNEFLTPENKDLLRKANIARRLKGYKYLWVRNARIFVKKDDKAPATLVTSEATLQQLDDFELYRRDRSRILSGKKDGGGVLIAVRKGRGIRSTRMKDWESHCEEIWLVLNNNSSTKPLYLNVAYIPPDANLDTYNTFLENTSKCILSKPDSNFLLIGDFNLPDITWKSFDNCTTLTPSSAVSQLASNFVDNISFLGLNQYCSVYNRNNVLLDLVLSTIDCAVSVSGSPLISEDPHHKAFDVVLNFPILPSRIAATRTSFNYKKGDYAGLNNALMSIDWE